MTTRPPARMNDTDVISVIHCRVNPSSPIGEHLDAPPAHAAGRFSSAQEVGMLTDLGRRIASANENLKAARLDGNCADIVTWRETCDRLFDEWLTSQPDRSAT